MKSTGWKLIHQHPIINPIISTRETKQFPLRETGWKTTKNLASHTNLTIADTLLVLLLNNGTHQAEKPVIIDLFILYWPHFKKCSLQNADLMLYNILCHGFNVNSQLLAISVKNK